MVLKDGACRPNSDSSSPWLVSRSLSRRATAIPHFQVMGNWQLSGSIIESGPDRTYSMIGVYANVWSTEIFSAFATYASAFNVSHNTGITRSGPISTVAAAFCKVC